VSIKKRKSAASSAWAMIITSQFPDDLYYSSEVTDILRNLWVCLMIDRVQ
jgi:hypothetical protein